MELKESQTKSQAASLFSPATMTPECRPTQNSKRGRLERRRTYEWKEDMNKEGWEMSVGSQLSRIAHGFMSSLWELIADHLTAWVQVHGQHKYLWKASSEHWELWKPQNLQQWDILLFSNFASTTHWRKQSLFSFSSHSCMPNPATVSAKLHTHYLLRGERKRALSLKQINNYIKFCTIKL